MLIAQKYKLRAEQYLKSYEKMLLLRRFEEKCGQLYGAGLIGGFCHLYIGQEAIITGIDLVRQQGDSMLTSYRDHAHIILSGIEPKYVMAELMGKESGCSKGKGGSMHMFNLAGKFYGGHGIVGAQVPIGTGLAFAEKYLNTANICFTFLGDGAVNQGQVFEAFNMAALWNLPVVYIIENNEYSMGTSVERSSAITDLYKKGQSFGIPGYQVDGMDLQAVYNYSKQAAEFARNEQKPIMLEMKTYRHRGHSMSDPAKYRSKEEVEQYKTRDSLVEVRNYLLQQSIANEEELKQIEQKIKSIITEAVQFSENSDSPAESELYSDIFKL